MELTNMIRPDISKWAETVDFDQMATQTDGVRCKNKKFK